MRPVAGDPVAGRGESRRKGGGAGAWLRGVGLVGLAAFAGPGCQGGGGSGAQLFELLDPEATGIAFENTLPEAPDINIITYLNYYNGGGVAAGDVNGDGLTDLFFTSNLGPDRLYLNRGGFRFEDVTERAGVGGGAGWTTGATMADVNGDGRLDLYVSSVRHGPLPGGNRLYINRGDGTFADCTAEYGLQFEGYSTQAAFLDYDLDGDLDLYLLNHSVHEERGRSSRPQRAVRHPRAGDRLYRNDGGRFEDVSEEAGIFGGVEGYGLGVVASDVNLDGCPDLYVANDFQENDFLYLNDCDGTFTESIARGMGHTSRSSMGVDAADFDNDGRPDVFVADMLPVREEVRRTAATDDSWAVDAAKRLAGYHPQYARNTLQWNRGGGRFSEIAALAGVDASDWSWAPLFADFDNDGWKDLLVTNGIYRRPNDLDYIHHISDPRVQVGLKGALTAEDLRVLERMPQVPIPNHLYRNHGGLGFTEVGEAWGLGQPGFSTGAAYADLDGDGALDLVVNNINAPAAVYRNRAVEVTGHHSIAVQLVGEGANTGGIGARVRIVHEGASQVAEQMPTRGFLSSVDHRLHFGLGGSDRVDSLIVQWPDGRVQVRTGVPVDGLVTLSQADAMARLPATVAGSPVRGRRPSGAPLVASVEGLTDSSIRHRENTFAEYRREPLIPRLLSAEGPALAADDVDGDGLDDLYLGGARWGAGVLLAQRPDGTFAATAQPGFQADSIHEDVDAAFFDADGDGDADLYVVSAGNEFWSVHEPLRDRLYLNDGRGRFDRAPDALPDVRENGGVVAPADFDADGDTDLFVGGRVVAGEYGATPGSQLLRNDGAGRFTDVTADLAPALGRAGMVTSAAWLDADGDGALDLVVAGEWMPVRLFLQEDGRLVDRTARGGLAGTEGWWSHVAAADLTGDGRDDLVLGNLGLNTSLRVAPGEPVRLHVHDFDGDGRREGLLTVHREGARQPFAALDDLTAGITTLRGRWPSYAAYAGSRLEDVVSRDQLRAAEVLEARTFASAVAVNEGDGRFRLEPLPVEAQIAPVHASAVDDFDGDGRPDLLIAGNFHPLTPALGRLDAGLGLLLRGVGDGRFEALDPETSGVALEGQVRALVALRQAGGLRLLVAARNDDGLLFLRPASARAGSGAASPGHLEQQGGGPDEE